MSTPAVTDEHVQRAFELLRRADWPATLQALLAAARQAALVEGLARRLAAGQGMAPPVDPTQPQHAVPLRAWDYPPRRTGERAAGLTERRRRHDSGPDLKRAAAGDRDD